MRNSTKNQQLTASLIIEQEQQKKEQINLHRRIRISLAILTVLICSFNIHSTNTVTLKHSRNLHRTLNQYILLHDDLDIYWFGYRAGQYLINYPMHQYFIINQFIQFLQRLQSVMSNLQMYSFGYVDQQLLNSTIQKIYIQYQNQQYLQYNWTIAQGLVQPFNSTDTDKIRQQLIQCTTMKIIIQNVTISQKKQQQQQQYLQQQKWDIYFIIHPFSKTSLHITIFIQQKKSLSKQHILQFVLGILTLILILHDLIKRQRKRRIKATDRSNYLTFYTYRYLLYKFKPSDTPDFLVAFFLLYSSIASFTDMFTLRYILILDGVTCLITWLYILKLYTQNDAYHVSFLIRKSYILVGRLFVSFGPLFIGVVLFALTSFCRYTTLFNDFHKSFISLFCVCYYNMTYQEFRTTQRTNPISTIFFTLLVMIFTICIYSGMLVSVFCSYMWNKREEKNKQEILQSLKIQCKHCSNKYGYTDGYKSNLRKSMYKRQSLMFQDQDDPQAHSKFRIAMIEKQQFLTNHIIGILDVNMEIVQGFVKQQIIHQIQDVYSHTLQKQLQYVLQTIRKIQEDDKTIM